MTRAGLHTVLYGSAAGGGVHLRHPKWADFDAWADLRRANRSHLSPWEPEWNERHLTRLSYRAKLARFKKMVHADTGYPFYIFSDGDARLIGACNITDIMRGVAQSARLGYWVAEDQARRGYGRAAVKAATQFCFETLHLHRIEAAVRPTNLPSIKVLESVGFAAEGTARGYLKIDGRWEDHIIYARLSTDA